VLLPATWIGRRGFGRRVEASPTVVD
jgi:hypothetical protein